MRVMNNIEDGGFRRESLAFAPMRTFAGGDFDDDFSNSINNSSNSINNSSNINNNFDNGSWNNVSYRHSDIAGGINYGNLMLPKTINQTPNVEHFSTNLNSKPFRDQNFTFVARNGQSWPNSTTAETFISDVDQAMFITDVFFYVQMFICLGGTIGNVFSLVIMLKASLRHLSMIVYLSAIAVFDTLILWFIVLQWLLLYRLRQKVFFTALLCKFAFAGLYTCYAAANFSIMAVAVERLCLIVIPFKARILCTVMRARGAVVLLILFCLFLNIPEMILWTADDSGSQCEQHLPYSWMPAFLLSYDSFRPIPTVVVPVFVISVLNVIMMVALFQSKRGQCLGTSSTTTQLRRHLTNSKRNDVARSTKMTYMLLTTSICFSVLSLPVAIKNILLLVLEPSEPSLFHHVVEFSCDTLDLLNHAVNFLLYIVSGSRFRKEVKSCFVRRRSNRQNSLLLLRA